MFADLPDPLFLLEVVGVGLIVALFVLVIVDPGPKIERLLARRAARAALPVRSRTLTGRLRRHES
jgi:hypothetical protein